VKQLELKIEISSRRRKTYQQVPEQANNSYLADRGDKDRGLLLDLRAEVL
jgi:hypothetical protein